MTATRPPPRAYAPPPDEGLALVHLDEQVAVVSKPAGLLSVPGTGPGKDDCLVARVQARVPDALIVHRLDMDTSGLQLFGRGAKVHRILAMQFQNRMVGKEYVALVAGEMAEGAGTVDLPLVCDWVNRPRQRVDHALGRPSRTDWRVLARGPGWTRVRLTPVTGRTHQLRLHMAALGHPILGDPLYADGPAAAAPRLMLHAERLAIRHPADGRPATYADPAPF